ncbi:hypothetical protein GCM10009733_097150 [Nonomuraea maheshkhaliensis]|uniref:Uncharacterized protein n=1 Tax=Nonomuraea maheshkhaliensis TaxID=419590 RepID=A0ABP4TBH1_9ACTN
MFFEPPPAREDDSPAPRPGLPVWYAPPADQAGRVTLLGVVLARTPNAVITLSAITAFSTGCLLNVEVATRRHTLSADDYQALQMSLFPIMVPGLTSGRPLPEALLRFGVRFADGTKATTVGQRFERSRFTQEAPPGPCLFWLPGGMSMRSGDENAASVVPVGLWLWPLPPKEHFELAVEWPAGGVELGFTSLDGSAVAAAAERSAPYWPPES